MKYCELNLGTHSNPNLNFGHWHYAHYYYSQVLYREGGEKWKAYRNEIYTKLINDANETPTAIGTTTSWARPTPRP